MKPVDYKLFPIADLICIMELFAEKAGNNSFSKSKQELFGTSKRVILSNY